MLGAGWGLAGELVFGEASASGAAFIAGDWSFSGAGEAERSFEFGESEPGAA